MPLSINSNLPAINAARNLTRIYSRLGKMAESLSLGLRIKSAADDPAELTVRELMRTDIASINQGVRNASDAVSLIQTAEGAMSVIDEKLIRMKELAEQAATGTFTTAQREIMNSEYQAMAQEIDRIANATDFNGVKLLDGGLKEIHEGQGLKVHFGAGNSSEADYYFVKIGDVRATAATGLRVGGDARNEVWGQGGINGAGTPICCGGGMTSLDQAMKQSGRVFSYGYNYNLTERDDSNLNTPSYLGGMWSVASSASSLQDLVNMVNCGSQARVSITFNEATLSANAFGSGQLNICLGTDEVFQFSSGTTVNTAYITPAGKSAWAIDVDGVNNFACALATKINTNSHGYWAYYNPTETANSGKVYIFKKEGGRFESLYACDLGYGGQTATGSALGANVASAVAWQNMDTYVTNSAGAYFAKGGLHWGTLKPVNVHSSYGLSLDGRDVGDGYNLRVLDVGSGMGFDFRVYGGGSANRVNVDGLNRSHFGEIQNAAWGAWAGAEIRSQSTAQAALEQISRAILSKDSVRSELGTMQSRLQNTITQLTIQRDSLQTSESEISDLDMAKAMTVYTKESVITQAAVAMLAQSNTNAKLTLSLIPH